MKGHDDILQNQKIAATLVNDNIPVSVSTSDGNLMGIRMGENIKERVQSLRDNVLAQHRQGSCTHTGWSD